MAFIPTANAAVVTCVYQQSGREVTNNFAFSASTPFDAINCTDLGNSVINGFTEIMAPVFHNSFRLALVRVVAQDSATAPSAEVVPATDVGGSLSGNPMSLNVAMNIGLITGLRGRSYRGLIKHPSTLQTWQSSQRRWNTTFTDAVSLAYISWFNAIVEDFIELPVIPVVISRRTNNAARVAGVATEIAQTRGYIRVGSASRRTS